MINKFPAFYMDQTFTINGLKQVTYVLTFYRNVPKYLNYVIQILACSYEASMSHLNYDIVFEKQSRI